MIATNVCMKMKKIVILLLGVLLSLAAEAQTTITGRITDARTGESLIGASLVPKNSGELRKLHTPDECKTATHTQCAICGLPDIGRGRL